jgi:CDGSH-type Zn-finger protein
VINVVRWVRKTAKGPARLEIHGKKISICRCGLSKNENGFCDGSHAKVQDEEEGRSYCYDEVGERVEMRCECIDK